MVSYIVYEDCLVETLDDLGMSNHVSVIAHASGSTRSYHVVHTDDQYPVGIGQHIHAFFEASSVVYQGTLLVYQTPTQQKDLVPIWP